MYSGDIEEEENDEEEPPVTITAAIITDPLGNEFLQKLNSLKIDCIQLHKTLETTLKNSGICRRYTIGSTPSSRGYQKILSEVVQKPQIIYKNPIRKQPSPRKTIATAASTTKKSTIKIQSNSFIEKHKQELKKYFQKRKELNEKPHLIPLRPKIIKAGFTRKNGTGRRIIVVGSKNNRSRKRSNGKKSNVVWLPRKTIPEPFAFTLREEQQPIKAYYALNFLQKLLDEKEEQEAMERDRTNRQFHARPPPETTYVSDSTFYVGQIKKDKSKIIRQPLVPKLNRLTSRSMSEPALSPRKPSFRAHPIPPSTYIRPSSMTDELRAQAKAQRTVELLLQSREPFGMKDHAVRSHVQYRIRHYPTCYSPKPSFQPHITKSVPDFRYLQREFANKLHNARESHPSTVVEPFKFHDKEISKHYCDNMKSTYRRKTKLKSTAAATRKASTAKSTTNPSSRQSNHTSETFNI